MIVVGKGRKARTIKIPKDYWTNAFSFQKKDGKLLPVDTAVFRPKNKTEKHISKKADRDIIKPVVKKLIFSQNIAISQSELALFTRKRFKQKTFWAHINLIFHEKSHEWLLA